MRPEDRLSLLVDSVKDYAIFLLDPNGLVESWNIGAQRIKGYKASEVVGKHFSIFYTQEDITRNHPAHELAIARKEGRYEEEGWRVRKDGSRFWANVVITVLRAELGECVGFAKVTRDLTERRMAEDTLNQALENLEQKVQERTLELTHANDKLQEAIRVRDEFLSIASHELRTPLTPIKLQLQGLARQVTNQGFDNIAKERFLRVADTCDKAITRLVSLVDNLLDVSRINAGKLELVFEEMELVSILKEVVDRYHLVVLEAPASIKGVFDRLRVEQVVTNLLSNAIKYGAAKPVILRVEAADDKILISVIDRGIGIPQEHQARIFERFERVVTKANVAGLGLGLYITKQIVEAHGGSIRLQSEEGNGSIFTVELPWRKA